MSIEFRSSLTLACAVGVVSRRLKNRRPEGRLFVAASEARLSRFPHHRNLLLVRCHDFGSRMPSARQSRQATTVAGLQGPRRGQELRRNDVSFTTDGADALIGLRVHLKPPCSRNLDRNHFIRDVKSSREGRQ